jgi:hypothetical protein
MEPREILGAMLKRKYPDLKREFRFCAERKFRADWYIPSLNVLIEYEGVFSAARSRHTNAIGYSTDCEKYNLAQVLGYRQLRYTAKNYLQHTADLRRLRENAELAAELTQFKADLKIGGTI